MTVRTVMVCDSCGEEMEINDKKFYLIVRVKQGMSYTAREYADSEKHLCPACNRILDSFLKGPSQ